MKPSATDDKRERPCGSSAGSRVVDKIDIGKMKLLVYGFIGFAGAVTFFTGF